VNFTEDERKKEEEEEEEDLTSGKGCTRKRQCPVS